MTAHPSAEEQATLDLIIDGLPHPCPGVTLDTPLSSLPTDKVTRAAVHAILARLLPGAPPELIDSVTTWRDAHDWSRARRNDDTGRDAPGPRVRLRPLAEHDLPALYVASSAPETGFRWRYRGATPSFAEFGNQLFEGVLAQYVVEDIATGAAEGLVCAYNAQFENGTVFIGFIRTSTEPGQGQVLEGMLLLIDLLFSRWPFRKVYAEVPEFNATGLFRADSRAARVEGRLVDHCFLDGRWWDMLTVALWREDWSNARGVWPAVDLGEPA